MGKDLVDLTFYRGSADEPWGFRLSGGKDYGQPLTISQVSVDSLAADVGLKPNDFLNSIAGKEVFGMTHDEAEKAIMQAGNRFNMVIEREQAGGRKISFENSATTFALKLSKSGGGIQNIEKRDEAFISNVPISEETPMLVDGSVNFKKYEKKSADISASKTLEKPHQRKDWNCPWVKKDGSGLKQAIRYVDQPVSSAKTSRQHFYSEPRSILAPEKELTREELEALIAEHGQESRPESRLSQGGSRPSSRAAGKQIESVQVQQQQRYEETMVQQQQMQQNSFEQHEHQRVSFAEETYTREREEDSQAPPDLEPVEVQQQQNFADMGQFGDQAYEPSADELIDVLKNLENLAAANPGLYRTIVEQIKGSGSSYYEEVSSSSQQQNGHSEQQYQEQLQYEQEQLYQQQQEDQMFQQQLEQQQRELEQQQMQMEQQQYQEQSSTTVTEQVTMEETTMSQESAYLLQQQQQQEMEMQMAKMSMSDEEFKQHQKMKRLEAEAKEEVRQALNAQREAKMKAMRDAQPQKPKEITVIAGDGKQVRIQLGGEQKDQADNRKQVAEAAGLKHVPLPDFDDTDNSAWAGSLKKTAKTKMLTGRAEEDNDENPWAGSLRHVKDKPRRGHKNDEKEDMHGGAPWMGTLRHVVHDNKVTKNYGVNQQQSKRYPDEDAGNPYESLGGSNAKPAFPLTPAAIINGAVMSRDDMARMEEEEEVARIRSNIGSKTVSTALLQVLMPKLLKMHETKYQPMDKVDAEAIMEEILGMQCGLNPNQQADANEEAEMIIRAIMQDEVDKSVYSKMADDLESAAKRMKKRKVKKVKENPSEIAA